MGFSVSGSTALVLVAAFIAFGAFYGSASNGAERVNDAYRDETDRALDRQNTDIAIANVSCENGLNISIENTGATTLSVGETDLLVDNAYANHSAFAVRTVDGDGETDLWFPGETFTLEGGPAPSGNQTRVKVVTGPGIARTGGC